MLSLYYKARAPLIEDSTNACYKSSASLIHNANFNVEGSSSVISLHLSRVDQQALGTKNRTSCPTNARGKSGEDSRPNSKQRSTTGVSSTLEGGREDEKEDEGSLRGIAKG